MQMKATKDVLIPDNAVRLSAESGGDGVCRSSEVRYVGFPCSCFLNIVCGRIGVILSAVVFIICFCLMVSCTESKEQKVLNHVESVIEEHPD